MEEKLGEITATDLLDELMVALTPTPSNPDGAYTSSELADKLGLTVKTIRSKLKRMKNMGKLEIVPVTKESLDGRLVEVPAYKLKD